jgi:hypothetical protein
VYYAEGRYISTIEMIMVMEIAPTNRGLNVGIVVPNSLPRVVGGTFMIAMQVVHGIGIIS